MVSEVFINSTGVVAGVVNGMVNLTGDYFSTMLLIVMFILILCFALQMPIEVSMVLVLPFIIVCYAYVPNFASVTGVVAIYGGLLLVKNFIIK